MIRFVRQHDTLFNGLNIYHWCERKFSIGFKLVFGKYMWLVRYNPKLKFIMSKVYTR